jgi:hypothetical protein
MTPPAPTPIAWTLRQLASLVGGGLVLVVGGLAAIVTAPIWLIILRWHETRDPEIVTAPDPARVAAGAAMEDHDVTNPFTAIGQVKPGWFRLTVVRAVLFLLDYGCRHVYTRGRLARVGTIHFARWVVIEGGKRVIFISNYDGSLESYMDDFINKAAFGLNLVFSNGVGYPTSSWLIFQGAAREQRFKAFLLRRRQATDVWYKAYPGLTSFDLARNAEIRAGFESAGGSEADVLQWLAKI